MSDVETLALRRAAVVLLVLSTARWYAGRSPAEDQARAPGPTPAADAAAHARATRAAADEGERRARPLKPGDTVDPNRAPEEELDRLPGVGPSTAAAIAAARDGGAVFRRPADLTSVRGIGPATVERIAPFLELSAPPPPSPARGRGSAASRRSVGSGPVPPVDVNRASVDELRQLPGIGPVIAERIVAERARASFSSIDDLVRVAGIGPATVGRLRRHVVVR
jgi:competence protein ComEA